MGQGRTQPSSTDQEHLQVLPLASLTPRSLTLALVSCVPVPAGRGVAGEARLEAEAGLEGGFGGAVCRRGGMEPGGLAGQGEDFLDMETK